MTTEQNAKILEQIKNKMREKKAEIQRRIDKRFKEYDESFEKGDADKAPTAQLAHEIEYLQGVRYAYEDMLDTIGNMLTAITA